MNIYTDRLKAYFVQNPPRLEQHDPPTVLNALYCCYRESLHGNTEEENIGFDALDKLLRELPLRQMDNVWDIVCDLCTAHEQRGFLDGVRLGAAMMAELMGE